MARGICMRMHPIFENLNRVILCRVDKRFFKPAEVTGWVVVVYEQQARFGDAAARDMISGLTRSFQDVGP